MMLCVGLGACGEQTAEPDAVAQKVPDKVAKCSTVQDRRGRTVAFRPTVDTKQLAATEVAACDIARDLIRRHAEFAKKTLDDFCSTFPPDEHEKLRGILSKYTAEEIRTDPQLLKVANGFAMCTEGRSRMLSDTLFVPAIHSVGMLPERGEGCAGYLYEVSLEGRPGLGYGVGLLGTCAGEELVPTNDPNLARLGHALVAAGYTGALPETYITPKGQTARFAPELAAPAQAAPAAAGGIPARFVGVYEQDPAQCASAEEAGAPGDSGLVIRTNAIESYESGCTLRTVSAASGDAFMGVFDCAVEGESEERTRSLRWSENKLFVDGDAQPFAKCNLEPPAPLEAKVNDSDEAPLAPPPASVARTAPVSPPAPKLEDRSVSSVRITQPEYPPAARRQMQAGTVAVKVEVLRDGSVGEVVVERGSGFDLLDASAVKEAKTKWRFTPAIVNGEAATAWITKSVSFGLSEG